jgi:hypothetical protein
MPTMYENLCGNCVSGIELTFHKRAFDFFISLHVDLTILKIVLSRAKNSGRQCHFKIWLECHK